MNGSADCRDIRHALGVYVLGAIDPAERSVVDAHLSTCPECREELAGLAGLPALLRRIPVGEAQQLADDDVDELPGAEVPSEEMLRSLLARTTRARQARRWRGLAAAAAVVLVAGAAGAAGWSAIHDSDEDAGSSAVAGHFTSATATNPATHVAATVRYAAQDWGTVLDT
jgi:anti-sigma factor RsiW